MSWGYDVAVVIFKINFLDLKLPSFPINKQRTRDGKEVVSQLKFLLSHNLWLREGKGPYFTFKR